jgi:hypothetical protein
LPQIIVVGVVAFRARSPYIGCMSAKSHEGPDKSTEASRNACGRCGGERLTMTLLTGYGSYQRCDACGHSWFQAQPLSEGQERLAKVQTTGPAKSHLRPAMS